MAIDVYSGKTVKRQEYEQMGEGGPRLINRTPSACDVK
jgi:hypothetical protein